MQNAFPSLFQSRPRPTPPQALPTRGQQPPHHILQSAESRLISLEAAVGRIKHGVQTPYWHLPFNLTPKVTLLVLSLVPKVCIHHWPSTLVRSNGWQDSGDQQQHGLHMTQHAQQRSAVEHPRGQLQLAGRYNPYPIL